MPKTVTLRIDDEVYEKLKKHAKRDHRPLSNFIEFATLRYIDQTDFVDESEMTEILTNDDWTRRLRKGSRDAARKKGKFVP